MIGDRQRRPDRLIADIRNFWKQRRKTFIGFLDNFLVLGGEISSGGAFGELGLLDGAFQAGEKGFEKPSDRFRILLKGGPSDRDSHKWIWQFECADVHQLFVSKPARH